MVLLSTGNTYVSNFKASSDICFLSSSYYFSTTFSNYSIMKEIAACLGEYVIYLEARLGMTENLRWKGPWEICGLPSRSGVRPGSLGLCPVRSWKPPRTETAQPHWQPAAPLASAFGGKLFLILLFQLLPVVSPPATSEPHHSTRFLVHPFLNCSPV